MEDSIEAMGSLVNAGLAAKALDAESPGRNDDINAAEIADAHNECANCGQKLSGNFCGNCGQKAHVHRSLMHVGEEFVHGITHFDGKAWHTLPMLLFRPGRLTRDYIEGKRARYIAPVPLFLLVVFLMFFVFSFVHIKPGLNGAAANMTPAQAATAAAETGKTIAELDREIAAATRAGNAVEVKALQVTRSGLVATRGALQARAEKVDPETIINTPDDLTGYLAEKARSNKLDINVGDAALNKKVLEALKNPELILYKIQTKIYKLSFLLVPMSLPWLWLMFAFRRDVRFYDHAIFALYSISFMSLLFIIGSIALALDYTNQTLFGLLIFVAPALHWYAQLRGTYALGRFGAAWRTVAISFAATITLILYLSICLAIGLTG